ncbi:MAG TPA: hypothetical protein VFP63_01790 [Dehalococcoidia bacterium]|nr:hypothetical protein [Dehalococcoidia bacterium]
MDFLERLPIPRRLSSRVWLISLPSALVSFEKQQKMPKLPIGRARFLGLPLVGLGVAMALWAWRQPGASIAYSGPFSHLARRPATAGGVLVLAGASFLLRSTVLAAYSLGLAVVTQTGRVSIEDPELDGFLGRSRKS